MVNDSRETVTLVDPISGGGSRETDPGNLKNSQGEEKRYSKQRPLPVVSREGSPIEELNKTDKGHALSNASAMSPLSPEVHNLAGKYTGHDEPNLSSKHEGSFQHIVD